MEKAVVLASGGINSTVAAAIAREQYTPSLIHFTWGHRTAERELLCVQRIATAMGFENPMVAELTCISAFGGNARSSRKMVIEDAKTLEGSTSAPATFVFGLLPGMLSLAAAYAGSIGARHIILGISEDHGVPGPAISNLYPDHRIEFVQTFNLMLGYAKSTDRELVVEAPLLELSRAEVVKLGTRMEVPFKFTWSCYQNNEAPCGRCRACVTRASGFLQAKVSDPITLAPAKAV